jgi:YidC/Oxa1 family membrane protein insertase
LPNPAPPPLYCPACPRLQLPSLAEGGTLWFTDLTVADPTYALPILAGVSFLATIELGAADGMQGQVSAREG